MHKQDRRGAAFVRWSGYIGGRIFLRHYILPGTILVQAAGSEMSVHHAARAGRFIGNRCMRIQLREKFLNGVNAGSKHEGLVAVIAGAPIAILEHARHRDLRQLLAIAENAEFRLARQHLAATQHAREPALVADAVIAQDFFTRKSSLFQWRTASGEWRIRCVPFVIANSFFVIFPAMAFFFEVFSGIRCRTTVSGVFFPDISHPCRTGF